MIGSLYRILYNSAFLVYLRDDITMEPETFGLKALIGLFKVSANVYRGEKNK